MEPPRGLEPRMLAYEASALPVKLWRRKKLEPEEGIEPSPPAYQAGMLTVITTQAENQKPPFAAVASF